MYFSHRLNVLTREVQTLLIIVILSGTDHSIKCFGVRLAQHFHY